MIRIKITSDQDWGCPYTPADAMAFARALCAAVRDLFPGAEVEHTYGLGHLRVVVDAPPESDLDIVLAVRECSDRVWDDGDFWP